MTTKINISIPKPCYENWDIMTPAEKGRFCSVCDKKVFDFTNATDKQIIDAYNKDKKLCGRFLTTQLERDIVTPKEKKSIWLASVFLGLLSFSSAKFIAQEKPKTEQTPIQPEIMGKMIAPKHIQTDKQFEVYGIVSDDNGALPGAIITIKGTNKKVSTDFDGKFKITVRRGDVLIFSFMGSEKEIKIKNDKQKELKIKIPATVLGGLGVIEKTSSFSITRFFKWKLV